MAELTKKCKRLWTKPGIRWLCGYFFVLLCGVGLVYYWRVAYSLGAGMPGFAAATTLIICGGFSAVYLLVFLAAHFLKQNLALKTAVLVFLAGLCFVFANPPMQAPDETMHFLRAYAVGSGQFLFDEKQQFPNDVNLLVRDFPGAYINGVSGEKLAPDDPTIADAFARYSADKATGAVAPGAFTPVQQLVPYFPQALGVAVGRLFGVDALACMYLARAANLLCYAVLCGYAAAVIRRFSAVLIALAISPVSLFMAGSCSSDGLFMGLTWIFIALCLSDVVTKKRLAVLALCFGLTFHAKYTTLALLPLLLLLPFEQKPRKGKKALSAAAQRWGVLAVCLAAGVIIYALLTGYTALASNYGRVPYADTGVDPGRQLAFVFSNLPRYLAVLLYSVYRDKANLFTIGNFGWMDMTVPFVSYFAPLFLLFASGVSALEGAREKLRTAYRLANDYVGQKSPGGRIFIVHRLDRDTSGVLLFAKSEAVKRAYQDNWDRIVRRRGYLAVVEGRIEQERGTVRSRLLETATHLVYSAAPGQSGGKEAVTRYELRRSGGGYSLLEVDIDTGRKNQIRVHMADLGHPIAGDRQYGARTSPLGRLGLHAHVLELTHPVTGAELRFEAPAPAAFEKLARE